jgi:hypothetical protein
MGGKSNCNGPKSGSMKLHYQDDHLRSLSDEDDDIIALWKRIMVLDATYSVSQV